MKIIGEVSKLFNCQFVHYSPGFISLSHFVTSEWLKLIRPANYTQNCCSTTELGASELVQLLELKTFSPPSLGSLKFALPLE